MSSLFSIGEDELDLDDEVSLSLALSCRLIDSSIHVVVNFLSQVIFVFLLFRGMVMYANEIETKEK